MSRKHRLLTVFSSGLLLNESLDDITVFINGHWYDVEDKLWGGSEVVEWWRPAYHAQCWIWSQDLKRKKKLGSWVKWNIQTPYKLYLLFGKNSLTSQCGLLMSVGKKYTAWFSKYRIRISMVSWFLHKLHTFGLLFIQTSFRLLLF